MKEILLLMARYNRSASTDMVQCLKTLPPEKITEDVGLYFKSILDTYKHYLSTNYYMFNGLVKTFCREGTTLKSSLATAEKVHIKELNFEEVIKFNTLLDELAIEVIENIDEFHSEAKLDFPTKKFSKPRYQIILGILNHTTHHRGQISGILDTWKIDNDFIGVLSI